MKNECQNDNEEQPTEGKERFDLFVKADSDRDTLQQCRIVSDAAAEISRDDLQYFCKKIEVTATSLVFKMARIIGDRAHEWEDAHLPWDWLIAYLFEIVDTDEFDQMMRVAEATKSGAFNPDMHALIVLGRERHPGTGVGADLTDHLGG